MGTQPSCESPLPSSEKFYIVHGACCITLREEAQVELNLAPMEIRDITMPLTLPTLFSAI
jgi:hypothetical protein